MGTEGATIRDFEALVLAAGAGARFGGGKLLARYLGDPLLYGALRAAKAAPVRRITVVTGADADAVAAAVRAFDPTIRIVHAIDHAEGMAASLRTGIANLGPDAAATFVFLGDMPRVPHAVLGPLAQAVAAGAAAAAPVCRGRRGNPVVLARRLFNEAATLSGDTGARPILEALGSGVARIETEDDGVLFDVDARSDLPPDG